MYHLLVCFEDFGGVDEGEKIGDGLTGTKDNVTDQ